ncbi:MAG: ABC transporter substrate-binding protein [Alphaproteobacteria bacterium]|nr:ABC transporter substrate-binding protein [Alphaproteobacteria bacterium]
MSIKSHTFATFRAVALLSCLTCVMGSPFAQAGTPPTPTPAAQPAQPEMSRQAIFIQTLGDQAISILADKTITEDVRDMQFRDMLREAFDLPTIARFVIGRSWAAATPEQKKEYLDLFEKLVVKTYSDRFALYTGEGFKVRSSVPESDKDTIINSDITHPDGSAATTVTWRIRQKGDKFGIIDVVVEGVSMSVTQRQEYSSVIQRNGGDVSALLDLMRQRVAEKPTEVKQKG